MLRNQQQPNRVGQISKWFVLTTVLLIAAFQIPVVLQAQGKGGGGSTPPPIRFTMELLTTPSGSPDFGGSNGVGMASDVNEQGFVVGLEAANSLASGNQRAFLWTPATGMVDLNTLLNPSDQGVWTLGEATAINDFNVICGKGYNSIAGRTRGFRLQLESGEIEEMADATGSYGSPKDINNFDEVVGYLWENGVGRVGTHWDIDNLDTIVDAGLNGPNGEVLSINDAGNMVGYSGSTGYAVRRALYWSSRSAVPIDLGYFAPGRDGVPVSQANSINDNGVVVGQASAGKYKLQGTWWTSYHAFRWTPSGMMQDLGALGTKNSFAKAINNAGDVVGYTDNGPFFYSQATGMFDLKAAITNLPSDLVGMNVVNINESREIVGNCGFRNDSRVWSIILRPVN